MRLFEVSDPYDNTTSDPPKQSPYVHPSQKEMGDPEWDNNPRPKRLGWHEPGVSEQAKKHSEWLQKRADALRQEDHLLFWRMCDFEDSQFPDAEQPHNVIIAAFPSEYDEDYEYEHGVPKYVEQHPGEYDEIEIPGSWFHEDMRTRNNSDHGPDYDDAHEICYVRKNFKYRKYIEKLVKRHNQIEKMLQRYHWDSSYFDTGLDKHVDRNYQS